MKESTFQHQIKTDDEGFFLAGTPYHILGSKLGDVEAARQHRPDACQWDLSGCTCGGAAGRCGGGLCCRDPLAQGHALSQGRPHALMEGCWGGRARSSQPKSHSSPRAPVGPPRWPLGLHHSSSSSSALPPFSPSEGQVNTLNTQLHLTACFPGDLPCDGCILNFIYDVMKVTDSGTWPVKAGMFL